MVALTAMVRAFFGVALASLPIYFLRHYCPVVAASSFPDIAGSG